MQIYIINYRKYNDNYLPFAKQPAGEKVKLKKVYAERINKGNRIF
jgi:hypothetical protein